MKHNSESDKVSYSISVVYARENVAKLRVTVDLPKTRHGSFAVHRLL